MTAQKLRLLSTYIWKGYVAIFDLIKDIIETYKIVPLTNTEKSMLKSIFVILKNHQFTKKEQEIKNIAKSKKKYRCSICKNYRHNSRNCLLNSKKNSKTKDKIICKHNDQKKAHNDEKIKQSQWNNDNCANQKKLENEKKFIEIVNRMKLKDKMNKKKN